MKNQAAMSTKPDLTTRLGEVALYLVAGALLVLAYGLRREAMDAEGRLNAAEVKFDAPRATAVRATSGREPGEGQEPRQPVKQWSPDADQIERAHQQFVASLRYDPKKSGAIEARLGVRRKFADLYSALGFSQREIDAFETAAAAKALRFAPVLSKNPEEVAAFNRSEANSLDKVVGEALGNDYVPLFREFLRTSDVREITTELAANCFYNAPLSSQQGEQLLRTCLRYISDSAEGGARVDPGKIDWGSVTREAGEFLQPAQIQVLNRLVSKRDFNQAFEELTGLPLRRPVRGL
ncbi:MAG: hypothetical protein NTV51_11135 [Verrucomicrobia bacterium]|nr:hypothetical protein [Verrucomicrobiota bacterium]